MADSNDWRKALYRFRPELEQRLEIEHCITTLHVAVTGGFLTNREEEDIKNQSPNYNRVRKLVEILANKDEKAFQAFTRFLKINGQTGLAELLATAAKEARHIKTRAEETSCNGKSLDRATAKSGAVKARRAVLDKLRQTQSSETSVFGVLVVGTKESGKSTLIRNLFGVDFNGTANKIQRLPTTVDGVSVTLHISYGAGKDNKEHLRQLQKLLQDKLITLVIYCLPVDETRLRPEPFEIIQRYSKVGVDWSRAVLALTFSDRKVAPKHEREHKEFSKESFFKQKRKEWMEGIKRQMVNDGVISKGSEDAIRMHSTTEDREDLLPDGQEWCGPLWEDIGRLLAI